MDKTFTGDDLNIFKHPARLIVAGTSNSGKTFLVNSLIKSIIRILRIYSYVELLNTIYKMIMILRINYI